MDFVTWGNAMEHSFSTTGVNSLLLLIGIAGMLFGTYKAVQQRTQLPNFILWGGFVDLGILCLGLAASGALAKTGIVLFGLFQLSSRALAFCASNSLGKGFPNASLDSLQGEGVRRPLIGALLALGLLAALGGSPFLVPEGRYFIVQALLLGGSAGALAAAIIMAVCMTVLLWLSVEAVRTVCLDATPTEEKSSLAATPKRLWLLALAVALFGLLRGPLANAIATHFSYPLKHAAFVHPAFYILYFGAFATLLVGWKLPSLRGPLAVLLSAAALGATLCTESSPIALPFLLMVTFIGLIVSLYSMGYMADGHRKGRYWFFLLLTFASLAGIVSTPDLGAMYGYWELMTFASYFLVVHEATWKAFTAGLKYYVMCAGGAFLMLPGFALFGGDSTIMAHAAANFAAMPPWLVKTALLLVLAGFVAKAGLVPLHSWLPDAHPAAPSSISGPLSGVITKMGFFGIIVLAFGHAGTSIQQMEGLSDLTWFGYGITFMGGLTLILGEYMALQQEDIKRMLAYSTLGQLGEIALVLGLGTWLATAGAMAHIINHAIMKDLLFLGAGGLILRAGSRNLKDLRGLGKQMPWTVTCMVIGLISIMGLPPFAGFFSKFMMIQAAVSAGYMGMAALILAGSLVGAIYYTRILKTLVFEERPADAPIVKEAPLTMRLALAVLAAASLLIGLFPQCLMLLVGPVASLCFAMKETDHMIMQAIAVPWPAYVALPIFGCIIPAFFSRNRVLAGWSAVLVLLVTTILVLIQGRDLDTLSFSFALIVPCIGMLNILYAIGYMEHSHTQWRFYTAFLCMCGGLIGMAASQHLFSFFLFWEIMSSWTLYMAIAHEGTKESLREAFKYFFFNILGAGFIFVGVCLLGAYLPFNAMLLVTSPALPSWVGMMGMGLLAIGFVMKAAQLPFRIDWQMHPALAPTPVSGYISSVLLKSAILGLIKLFMLLGGGFALASTMGIGYHIFLTNVVMWIGGITIIMAATQALFANNLKLVFIYSTVSQIGYMVLAVGCGTALGLAGGMLHVVNHVFFKDLLFLVCGAIMLQTHKDNLDALGGIGRRMPFTLCMFAIAGLSLVGVPPTSGFSSKWIIYHALMQAGQPLLALLSLIGSVITLAYIAKFLHLAFLGAPGEDAVKVKEAPFIMRVPMAILGLGCLVTGIFPGLALFPINSILAEYGAPTFSVAITGLLDAPGAWNATALALMMGLALFVGWKFVRHFVDANNRETDIHSCGLEPEMAVSRMGQSSVYGGLKQVLRRIGFKENSHD